MTAGKISAISINNLDYFFGEKDLKQQVLFGINLEISVGEIILLTGPSGSGKTTLLTLVGALRSAQHGSLVVLGKELVGATKSELLKARRRNGYIFQAHNLHHSLTAAENVSMGLEVHGAMNRSQRRKQSLSLLQEVGLKDRADYYPDSLSGGQKQRVAIARALVGRPQLILADEPTAALDSHTGRDVVILMQKLAREHGCTILMVTHDNRILDIADRIINLEDGKIESSTDKAQSVAVQ